jgi:hypothetical protein
VKPSPMIKSTGRTRPVDAVARRDTLAGSILQKSRQSPGKPSRKRRERKSSRNPRNPIMNLWAAPRVRKVPRVLPARNKPTLNRQQKHLLLSWLKTWDLSRKILTLIANGAIRVTGVE